MSEEAELRRIATGAPEHNDIILWAETFRLAFAGNAPAADEEAISHAMTGAVVFAGTLMGALIISGLASDADKRRVTEGMMRNFRTGIQVGKERALGGAAASFGGTA